MSTHKDNNLLKVKLKAWSCVFLGAGEGAFWASMSSVIHAHWDIVYEKLIRDALEIEATTGYFL